MTPAQSRHPFTSPVIQNVRSLPHHQNQQKRGPSGNCQHPPGKRHVSVPAVERDSSQGGTSVVSTIQGQNSTASSSLNNFRFADITPSTTLWRSIISPTATPGISRQNTPAPSGTTQTNSTCCIVSSPTSGIASTPTPLCVLDNLPTAIPNPEAGAFITNPLRTWAIERNQTQRQWQLQTQAVSTPQSVVSGSCSIHRSGHSDVTTLVFPTGRLLELNMWNRRPFKSSSELETVSYATRRVAKALAKAPH